MSRKEKVNAEEPELAVLQEVNTNLRRLIELTEMLVFGPAPIEQELNLRSELTRGEQEKELELQRDADRRKREDKTKLR